ncbi:MAG: AAA family ATPase [Anaerovoracaceae bacterium]
MLMEETKLKLINMADVEVEVVEWLLYPLIPFGKITILQGDPGEGKTTVMLHLIACLTKGEPLSFVEERLSAEAISVIYQTAEDGLGDTIKPRLLEAGADCSKVLVIDDSEEALTIADDRLELAIETTGAKLIVLDPLQGYLGSGIDMHRANEVRPLMHRLSVLAEKYKCAIVLIGHMNKNSMGKAGYRALGSIDIPAAARSVIVCGRVKEDPEMRVLCQIKNSLAPEAQAIAFRLDKENGFQWVGEVDVTIDELLSGECKASRLQEAELFLKEILADGETSAVEIYTLAEQEGIKQKTLRKAKDKLKVTVIKRKNKWYWNL